jgi:hypothetical protein
VYSYLWGSYESQIKQRVICLRGINQLVFVMETLCVRFQVLAVVSIKRSMTESSLIYNFTHVSEEVLSASSSTGLFAAYYSWWLLAWLTLRHWRWKRYVPLKLHALATTTRHYNQEDRVLHVIIFQTLYWYPIFLWEYKFRGVPMTTRTNKQTNKQTNNRSMSCGKITSKTSQKQSRQMKK